MSYINNKTNIWKAKSLNCYLNKEQIQFTSLPYHTMTLILAYHSHITSFREFQSINVYVFKEVR